MTLNLIQKKLGIKTNTSIIFINATDEFIKQINILPQGAKIKKQFRGSFDVILLFGKKKTEVEKVTSKLVNRLNTDGYLWVAYPKKSSGIETDLNRNKCWDLFWEDNFKPVSLISLNEYWSAMRFKPVDAIRRSIRKIRALLSLNCMSIRRIILLKHQQI